MAEAANEKKAQQFRERITPAVVDQAIAAAKKATDSSRIADWNDTEQRYLTLRQRGRSVRWIVRAYGLSRKIGSATGIHVDPTYLSLRDAREKAKQVYADMAGGKLDQAPPEAAPEVLKPPTWTWADLDREYQAMIAKPRWINRRMKPASQGTCDDVRLAFAKPSYQALHPRLLTELNRPLLNEARNGVVPRDPDKRAGVHRQREKCVTYFRAAMSWAADKHPDESGLTEDVDRWWERLTAGEPRPEEMAEITARQALHRDRKDKITVEHIGAVLARHEAYCAGRTAEDKISPGIRFGLWWVCFTANRRFSTVKLRRGELIEQDEFGEAGWGRAMWPADTMKAKEPFWLPLPRAVVDIALGSIADYTQLVKNRHGEWPSQWVFASTRREGRNPENDDVSVYPNSLNRHLLRMRRDGALDGLPYFSLHLARAAMTKFLEKRISPVAASLVLAHSLPDSDKEMSPTTREYYSVSQRMEEKAEAMGAWSDALTQAFLNAGGTMPKPSASPPTRYYKAKKPR
ncbi:hypothetical protein [Bradyrhizobium japonicum]|uniref:hypothetical protein n=1 Tax=Bradyrhizobium japonicum TaxID=375 RepID=UPI001BA678F8|nr:hypothetical protein [Bradyrhizobium japonicum]MBR0914659.1 hypothetical protein [Bradyrhizobium japonicum]